MSYSRWLGSNWYVFWQSSDAKKADDELCAIWYVEDERLPTFSFKKLKDAKNVDDLRQLLGLDIRDDEYTECLEYVKQFIKEVEEYYNERFK